MSAYSGCKRWATVRVSADSIREYAGEQSLAPMTTKKRIAVTKAP